MPRVTELTKPNTVAGEMAHDRVQRRASLLATVTLPVLSPEGCGKLKFIPVVINSVTEYCPSSRIQNAVHFIPTFKDPLWNRDSSVGITTRLRAEKPRNHGSIPGKEKGTVCSPQCSGHLWGPERISAATSRVVKRRRREAHYCLTSST